MKALLVLIGSLVFVGFVESAVNKKWILPAGATAEQIKERDEAMLSTLSAAAKTAFDHLKEMGKMEWDFPMYIAEKDKYLATLPKSVRDEILNFGQ